MWDDEPSGKDRRTVLPCGAAGYWDGCGFRCQTCFTVFGSLACPCNDVEEEQEDFNDLGGSL